MYSGLFFPITIVQILASIEDVVTEWELLGLNLDLSNSVLDSINADKAHCDIQSKKKAMIAAWMGSSPACWWLLVKALEKIGMNFAAGVIRNKQGNCL